MKYTDTGTEPLVWSESYDNNIPTLGVVLYGGVNFSIVLPDVTWNDHGCH